MAQDQKSISSQLQLVNQPHDNTQTPVSPPYTKTVERKVHIRIVEGVAEHDFPQATKTWQALEAAGIDPGNLVANALEQGHDYRSDEMLITQPFVEKETPVGESVVSDQRLVGYSYVNSKDLKLISNPQSAGGLEIVLQSRQVALLEEEEPKAVKMTAIVKQKPIDTSQLLSSFD